MQRRSCRRRYLGKGSSHGSPGDPTACRALLSPKASSSSHTHNTFSCSPDSFYLLALFKSISESRGVLALPRLRGLDTSSPARSPNSASCSSPRTRGRFCRTKATLLQLPSSLHTPSAPSHGSDGCQQLCQAAAAPNKPPSTPREQNTPGEQKSKATRGLESSVQVLWSPE